MIVLSWSGGKDSAIALERLRRDGTPPELLLSTIDEQSGRVTHHGTPRELLEAQALAAGLPLLEIPIPFAASAEIYSERMREAFSAPPLSNATAVAFGDIYLEDLRSYREERLAAVGVGAIFPLWGNDTAELAVEIATHDYEAIVVSIDPSALDPNWLGRWLDPAFFADLPPSVDPCGERGEFHTFVRACPAFSRAVSVGQGARLDRHGFPFLELVLDD